MRARNRCHAFETSSQVSSSEREEVPNVAFRRHGDPYRRQTPIPLCASQIQDAPVLEAVAHSMQTLDALAGSVPLDE